MRMVTEEELRSESHDMIWAGFCSPKAVIETVTKHWFRKGEAAHLQVQAIIESEFEKKSAAELSWLEVTDCDRLDNAFNDLNRSGIVALQCAGFEHSEGHFYVDKLIEERHGGAVVYVGYVFFHLQDLDRAMKGDSLLMNHGDLHESEANTVEIAQTIVNTLQVHGLQATWSGNVMEKIEIKNIVWQRRHSVGPHLWETPFTRELV